MANQIVVSGNRILGHGTDCFLSMGGVVICPESGKVYQNATVVNIEGGLPADIDSVGYEYHAGEFVPCAPYGKGKGNVAVVCNNDCKSIKDSGINIDSVAKIETTTYKGTGNYGNTKSSLTFDGIPLFVMISRYDGKDVSSGYIDSTFGVILPDCGFFYTQHKGTSSTQSVTNSIYSYVNGNTIYWQNWTSAAAQLNQEGYTYKVVAVTI